MTKIITATIISLMLLVGGVYADGTYSYEGYVGPIDSVGIPWFEGYRQKNPNGWIYYFSINGELVHSEFHPPKYEPPPYTPPQDSDVYDPPVDDATAFYNGVPGVYYVDDGEGQYIVEIK